MDDQQRARELLADYLQQDGYFIAQQIREGNLPTYEQTIIKAITAALRAAPEGFVMVPVIATEAMLSAAYPRNERIDDSFDRQGAWADCIAARPQGASDG